MSDAFESYRRVNHKVVQNNEVGRAVWELHNPAATEGNCAIISTFEVLKHFATCDLEVDKKAGELRSQLKLRFKFDEYITTRCYHRHKYLSLCIEVLHGGQSGVPLGLSVQVDNLRPDLSVFSNYTPQTFIVIRTEEERRSKLVVGEFIRCSSSAIDKHGNATGGIIYNTTSIYLFGITVRLIHPLGMQLENIGTRASQQDIDVEQVNSTLRCDLKKLMSSGNCYYDLKLKTKGGTELGAHKFLVAARSPILDNLIRFELNNNKDFNGVLSFPELETKVMVTILHWMYTEEIDIDESIGYVMENLVDAAAKFGLREFNKLLETKFIRICTVENMFHLLRSAQRFRMEMAFKDVYRFIKTHA